jgi:hypothetical protein
MRRLLILSFFYCLLSISPAHALSLSWGESITSGGQTITCGSASEPDAPSSQGSVTSKECQKYDVFGKCISYDEETHSGRYCATGEICQNYDVFDKCISYNTVSECGDHGCTTSRECQKRDVFGQCISYDTVVSCH